MTDRDTVLALNQSFYRAFNDRDYAAMDALWAARLPVSCIHPGWMVLVGREAVMASWESVLDAPTGPAIRARNERVMLYGETAVVLCEEVLGGAVLAATNLFVREDGSWRLAHHQAGPIADPLAAATEPVDGPPPGGRLH
ncbi:nuclear transport factor 2 family protein [Azospirillum sp. sgz302134]